MTDRLGEELADRIRAATAASVSGWRSAELLFSGGLDSAVVAAACPSDLDLTLVTVGAAGSDDASVAPRAAELLHRPHRARTFDSADVVRATTAMETELQSASPPFRSALAALSLALEATEGEHVLCGQGADELFYGYAHFHSVDVHAAIRLGDADLARLLERDWPQTVRLAQEGGRALRSPFLEERFLEWARTLAPSERYLRGRPKHLLRSAARALGVPESIAGRPKKAIQFGSGLDRLARAGTRVTPRG
ncbi:MAG TPA: asparagine synthase-related protein [Thermoplasmata archaeon]|nr:asparagine synthase-related protein [Thermoplasmata archaeon]